MDDIDELLNIGSQQSQINNRRRTPISRTPRSTNFSLRNPYQRPPVSSSTSRPSHNQPPSSSNYNSSTITTQNLIPTSSSTTGENIISENQPILRYSPATESHPPSSSSPSFQILETLEKILQNQDRLDKKFDKQQRDIELLQRYLIPPLELRRELSIEKPCLFPTRKTFVESPNLLSRDTEIFNSLRILQGQIQSIEVGIHKSAEKITKDEGILIRNYVKSIFTRLDLQDERWFDRTKLCEMFCRRGLKMMTASTITLKKASVLHCLSEAISEEKSKFKSRLLDSGFRQLPIKDFAQHLFTRSTFIGCDDEKIMELQAVAAKWRHITSHEWNSNIPNNKWWPQIFRCLCSLFKDMQDKTFMSIHLSLLEEDQNLYPSSSTEFRSQNNSDLDFQPIGDNELLDSTFPEDYETYPDNQRSEAMDMEHIDDGLDDVLSDLN